MSVRAGRAVPTIRGVECTLVDYIRRVELYGSECVMQVAATHLPPAELAALKGQVEHWERNYDWHRGEWVAKRHVAQPRPCAECGQDLPSRARASMQRHGHCRSRAARRKAAA